MSVVADFLGCELPFDESLLPSQCYLVGGIVRDVLLGRKRKPLDIDFVVPHDAIRIAKTIARKYRAGFVVLDPIHIIARVVFPQATVDFAQQEGDSLFADLGRRDYTINAIAFDCQQGMLIDFFGGQEDLQKGIIRMINPQNLQDDPLRLLRAYRLACQLDFTIESDTRYCIKKLAPLLARVAMERVNQELDYLWGEKRGSYWLKETFKDGLLSICFPSVTEEKVDLLEIIDESANFITANFKQEFGEEYRWYKDAKLACLVSEELTEAEEELWRLKSSRQEVKTVLTILKHTPDLFAEDFPQSKRKQYFFFQAVQDNFPVLAVFALANRMNFYNKDRSSLEAFKQLIVELMGRYLNPEDIIAHPKPILTGNEIMKKLKLSPGPLIGEMLTEAQIAYIEGKVKDKTNALQWLEEYLERRKN
ncbi:MAG: CCA tRNA nucleotidyltransferase [Geminocystis sp.]|nr:CCA tRNA nucleotidyltransferase [Geminocystis sp.]HIK36980.1 CCA tRNA nucleotidyltransferase [Geminocystis sp. M7585_C2015_104]MCS7147099.1 CCA tRNA nucleotidyltransferase [Geminocystis sp.]MCX8079152.1 CCA tRNA nucleotidyltransferase [Geminocystis sp.]MDW8116735.1 CCA tRNA nucleotidyltransferase [Geminocystis sp.]